MKARAGMAVLAVLAAVPPVAEGVELVARPIVGVQLLQQKDTSFSHGPLHDEVTLGRTVLGGASLGVRVAHHEMAVEVVVGPYHNDIDRYCISHYDYLTGRSDCGMVVGSSTRYAVLYGLHYTYALRDGSRRPFLGVGIGGKTYSYGEGVASNEGSTSLALQVGAGMEIGTRTRLRVEARFVATPANPYLAEVGGAQEELQIRASLGLRLRK